MKASRHSLSHIPTFWRTHLGRIRPISNHYDTECWQSCWSRMGRGSSLGCWSSWIGSRYGRAAPESYGCLDHVPAAGWPYVRTGHRGRATRSLSRINCCSRKDSPCRLAKPKTVSDRSRSDRGSGASSAQHQLQRSRSGRVSQSKSIIYCLGLIPDKTSSAAERSWISVGRSTCNKLLGIAEANRSRAGVSHRPKTRISS